MSSKISGNKRTLADAELPSEDTETQTKRRRFNNDEQKEVDLNHNGDKYPVLPLIMPNNCQYDETTKKMTVHEDQLRNKLIAYEPALNFIRNIKSKIATISIVGKARTGKSLIAGELYAPGIIPCPFDLGHTMDACTYGVWVTAKTIKHPHNKDKDMVILIFDVEGTGYHQAKKQSDLQLMVVTILISSYFIYNSKCAVDTSALNEIEFVTKLASEIQMGGNKDGQDFNKFFPKFMWVLRDVHLVPEIDGKKVSFRDYFTVNVLKREGGFQTGVKDRQWIRTAFLQMFQTYDAFTLPMPHAKKEILQKLGTIPRSELEPEFIELLQQFCDKVITNTECFTLLSKKANGEDKYIQCTGAHLAPWIEQCIESVNNPDKIPEIVSMTDAVMRDVYRKTKDEAINEYYKLLLKGLKVLRNNDNKQPLDENFIIELHLQIFDDILQGVGSSLQINKSIISDYENKENNQNINIGSELNELNEQQFKVFNEFCDEIGHSQIAQQIGQKGLLSNILSENRELSTEFCNNCLNSYFTSEIKPMLDDAQNYQIEHVMDRFVELENIFFTQCKGPSKDKCWNEFIAIKKDESLADFTKMKGYNEKLLKQKQEIAERRDQERKLKQHMQQRDQEFEQQQKLMKDDVNRINKLREKEKEEIKKKTRESEQRTKDMYQAQFNELAKHYQGQTNAMTKEMKRMQKKNDETQERMLKKLEEIQKPPVQYVSKPIPFCLIQ